MCFHDGKTLTADDVVWSLERARSHPGSVLKGALSSLESIRKTGPSRVRLTLREPDASLPRELHDVGIVSRSFVSTSGEAALARSSAGTGPYRIRSVSPALRGMLRLPCASATSPSTSPSAVSASA